MIEDRRAGPTMIVTGPPNPCPFSGLRQVWAAYTFRSIV